MHTRLVVSLGGNAFARKDESMSMAGQFRFAADTLAPLASLVRGKTELLVTHGNGPQVGYILTRVEEALGSAYKLPLEVCVAESEGEIGYVLQQTLHNICAGQRPVATLLTQVVVDAADPAFSRPTKPIGPWIEPSLANKLEATNLPLVKDGAGRCRRVVPSPAPVRVVETPVIDKMLSLGVITIAAGGGGIPVIEKNGRLEGVEAVVDKDLATALLAIALGADRLVLVTDVDGVYENFNSENARRIESATPEILSSLAEQGHFAEGTMGPKVAAAVQFVLATGNKAVICQPKDLEAALRGNAGTIVET